MDIRTGFILFWNTFIRILREGQTFFVCLVIFIITVGIYLWKRRSEEKLDSITADDQQSQDAKRDEATVEPKSSDDTLERRDSQIYRFRKRDKAVYTAKRLLRKMRSIGRGSGNGTGRKFKPSVMKFAAQWLLRTKERQLTRPLRGPPSTFFEPDIAGEDAGTFPPEIFYMLKNIRVFGHFETPCFLELCRHVTELSIPAGQYLFRPGDPDDSIYVVQKGHISVFIKDNDQEYDVKKVGPGESILSLLSILDVLTGHSAPFKTVAAKTNEESVILKLSGAAFNDIFERYPESWVRTIQIIALRLQRVTFTTLHQYLGLSWELTKPTLRHTVSKPTLSSGIESAAAAPERASFFSKVARRASSTYLKQSGNEAPSDPKHSSSSAALPSAPQVTPGRSHLSKQFSGTKQSDEISDYTVIAKEQLSQLLGLAQTHSTLLDDKVRVQVVPPGYTLTEQGSYDVDLIYVLTGTLELTQKSFEDGKQVVVAMVHADELVGGLAILTGEHSFYTIKASRQSRLAIISKCDFYQIMREKPRVVLNVAHSVVVRLSPFIRSIDFALDWEMCDAGKALYNQDDPSDSLYVVLSGRLRSVSKKSETVKHVVGEYGRGDLVGLVEVLTSRPRATTVISVRYTELSKLPNGLLNFIKMKYPQVLTRIIHLLGHCILGQQEAILSPGPYARSGVEAAPHVASLNTIAIAAVSDDVPLAPFALELMHALKSMKSTLLLSRDVIERDLGPTALLSVNEHRLFSWLSQQEDAYSVVLYQCDYGLTTWSRRCIRQADCVLIVAKGDSKPSVGPLEELFDRLGVRAQKNLILLWSENVERPVNTQEWLDACGWVSSHYHIRAPHRMYIHARRDARKMAEYYEDRIAKQKVDTMSDFARLARMLTGRAIGLVLGGGGARGAAHLGILKALKEYNVPIDFVGGTSIGSLVGGIYCGDPDVGRAIQTAREWFMDMSSYLNYLFEFTYPHSAMFTGAGFNRAIQKVFKDRLIEDLWIPYFNVTTDISASEMRVHRSGMLWRYCRASMSLAGYFPPICDPVDDHQLLDGGYVNNLPADVMRSMRVGEILAVDVGSQDETNLTNYGDTLSGFWVLWHRMNPFRKPIRVLNMAEIQTRLAYVSCVRQLEMVKKAPYCYYMRPPIDNFKTLDFALFDEICNVGLQYGKSQLHEWSTTGKLAEILKGKTSCQDERFKEGSPCTNYQSPQSFTDLAALVSKIQPRSHFFPVLVSDDESEEFEYRDNDEGNGPDGNETE